MRVAVFVGAKSLMTSVDDSKDIAQHYGGALEVFPESSRMPFIEENKHFVARERERVLPIHQRPVEELRQYIFHVRPRLVRNRREPALGAGEILHWNEQSYHGLTGPGLRAQLAPASVWQRDRT